MKHFTEEIVTLLREKLPGAVIEAREVVKSGEKHLTGVCIRKDGDTAAPVLYLDEPFELYQQGVPAGVIADRLLEVYERNMATDAFDTSCIIDWNRASERLTVRLTNLSHNTSYLENKLTLPIPGTDTAFVYSLDLSDFREGASVTVTRDMLTAWHVTPGVVHDIAFVNTARLHPASVLPMRSIMNEMTGCSGPDFAEEPVMYVVTSDTRVNGAVSILFPGVAEALYNKIGDFYILPSSVHEVIDINRTQVAPEDRLADDVFEVSNGNLISVFPNGKPQVLRSAVPAWLAE